MRWKRYRQLGGAPLALLLLASYPPAGSSQEPQQQSSPDPPSFRVEAYSSLHEVRVLDPVGNVVRDLAAHNFRVFEEERLRPVSFFLERSDYPVTLACLVDTGSNMSEEAVTTAKKLLLDLIHRLDPNDQILLVAYGEDVHYLSRLTSDRLDLLEGLRNLSATGRRGAWTRLSRLFGSDAWTGPSIDEVLLHLKSRAFGEKVLLVFSAGFANIGLATYDHLEAAGARLIAVSVDNRLGDFFNFGGDQAARRRVIRKSGGVSYQANDVLQRVEQLRNVVKHHYLLAFEPAEPEKLARAKIRIEVLSHPEYSIHFTRRTRSTSSFY